MEELLVAEGRRCIGLLFRVHHPQEQQAGGGDAHRLPHLCHGPLKPGVGQHAFGQPHHAENVPENPADHDHSEREETAGDDFKPNGTDRGHHEEIESGARDTLHEPMVHHIDLAEARHAGLHDQAANHAEWKEGKGPHDRMLTHAG